MILEPPGRILELANASQERLGSTIAEETLKNITFDDKGEEEQINSYIYIERARDR